MFRIKSNTDCSISGFAVDLSIDITAEELTEAVSGTGITVNSILPGPNKSRRVSEFVGSLARAKGKTFEAFEKEFFKKFRPTSLIKRFAKPEEVASIPIGFPVGSSAGA